MYEAKKDERFYFDDPWDRIRRFYGTLEESIDEARQRCSKMEILIFDREKSCNPVKVVNNF